MINNISGQQHQGTVGTTRNGLSRFMSTLVERGRHGDSLKPFKCSDSLFEQGVEETERSRKPGGRLRHAPDRPPLYFVPLCWFSVILNTCHMVWGLPSLPHAGWGTPPGQGAGWEGSTPAEQLQPPPKMRSEVVLRKQRCFLRSHQKPTPCLPLHIFAAEGETVGNRSFPDVIGMLPAVFSRRHRGVGSGRAGWEVMQLWTRTLGSLQREVRFRVDSTFTCT